MNKDNWSVVALTILLCVVGILDLTWAINDHTAWPWDQAWYAEETLVLNDLLTKSFSGWLTEMASAFGVKAPAVAWIGQFFVPLRHILGSIESALLLLNIISTLLAGWFIFLSAKILWPESRAGQIAAALTVLTAPLCVGMSHQYFVEALQLAVVSATIYLSLRPITWATLLALPGVIALGLLTKITTPAYLVAIGLIFIWRLFKARNLLVKNKTYLSLAIIFSFVWIGGALAWYIHNWAQIVAFAKLATDSDAVALYGSRNPFIVKFPFWLSHSGFAFSFSPLAAGIFCGFVFLAFLSALVFKRSKRFSFETVFALGCLFQIILILVLFSLQINEETRYLLPLIAYIALLMAFTIRTLGNFFGIAANIALLAQGVVVYAISLGYPSTAQRSAWLLPYHADANDQTILTEAVLESCPQALRYNIIGQEVPAFNANSASFYIMKSVIEGQQKFRCYYTSLGYTENNPDAAWQRMVSMRAEHIIFRKDILEQLDNPFNRVSEITRKHLESSSNFKQVQSQDARLLLYRETIK